MRRLIWAFAGRTYHVVGNLLHWLMCNKIKSQNLIAGLNAEQIEGVRYMRHGVVVH